MNIKKLLCLGTALVSTIGVLQISAAAGYSTSDTAIKTWTLDTSGKDTPSGSLADYPDIVFGNDGGTYVDSWYNKMLGLYRNGYIEYTPQTDGVVTITGTSRSKKDDKNSSRWIGYQTGAATQLTTDDAASETDTSISTNVNLLLRADVEINSKRLTTNSTDVEASFNVESGTKYYIRGAGTYLKKIVFTPNSYATYDSSQVFTGDSDANDKATAVVFSVGSNNSTLTSIDTVSVTYKNETKTTDNLNITTDGGTVLFGVIVPEAIENMDKSTCANTFAVNVN